MPVPELNPEAISPSGNNLLAFSGGPDSACLLWMLHRTGLGPNLRVVHIDHGLDPGSAARARAARALAASIGSDCEVRKIEVVRSRRDGGPEAASRRARYACLRQLMQPDDYLLTAHHADDHAETVLLRLLRGGGPEGLAGLRARRRFRPGWLGRPLLGWSRADIEAVLADAGLRAVADPANLDRAHDRNFLRHDVMPLLEKRWPGYRSAIARTADRQRHAARVVRERAARDWAELARPRESGEWVIELGGWLARDAGAAIEVVREWCRRAELPPPASAGLEEFRSQCAQAAPDSQPKLAWPAGCLRAWSGRLWLDAGTAPIDSWRQDWIRAERIEVPAGGHLLLDPEPPARFGRRWHISHLPPGARLRRRPDGPSQRVSELLRRAGLPPWRRRALPALFVDDVLRAVASDWLDHEFAEWLSASGGRLSWRGRPRTLLPCPPPEQE